MFRREQRAKIKTFIFKTFFCAGCGYLLFLLHHLLLFNGNDGRFERPHSIHFPHQELPSSGPVQWSDRQGRVEEYCGNNKKKRRKYQRKGRSVFHVSNLQLNFCLVVKAASSSISQAVVPHLRLNKKPSARQYPWLQAEIEALGGEYKRFLQDNQTLTPTFLIARHPFAR